MGLAVRRVPGVVRRTLSAASPGDVSARGRNASEDASAVEARVRAIVSDLVSRPVPAARRIRGALAREPRDTVIRALASAASAEKRWNRYVRVVNMLGSLDDTHALVALRGEASRKDGLAVHAVHALGRMAVAGVEDALWECLRARYVAVRRAAAMALARRRTGRVVAPLCRYARRAGKAGPDRTFVAALKSMGSVRDLFTYLLTDDTITVHDRVEAIEHLEAMRREFGRFNSERILTMYAENPDCAWSAAAGETLDLYMAKRTLLRPSDRLADDTLLRPAHGPDRTPAEMLLRPHDGVENPEPPASRSGFFQTVVQRLRDLLDGED